MCSGKFFIVFGFADSFSSIFNNCHNIDSLFGTNEGEAGRNRKLVLAIAREEEIEAL